MKIIFYLITISNVLIQQNEQLISKSVQDYARYFDRNKLNLDPIEGIWQESAVGTLYKDNKVVDRLEEQKRATWIVVKKYKRVLLKEKKSSVQGENMINKIKIKFNHLINRKYSIQEYYKILNVDGNTNGFTAYFLKKKDGSYFLSCNILEIEKKITTNAKLIDNESLTMEYYAPKSFIEFFNKDYYLEKNDYELDQVLFWQIEWRKLY
tara:strand:+ start:65 stop:691 length:627 start_codon:yes stop_codon:yes gene_type:complete